MSYLVIFPSSESPGPCLQLQNLMFQVLSQQTFLPWQPGLRVPLRQLGASLGEQREDLLLPAYTTVAVECDPNAISSPSIAERG